MGVCPGTVYSVCVRACALMQVLLLPVGRGFMSQCLDNARPGLGDRWVCPGFGMTFEPRQARVGWWQEVKGEAMPVNEALYAGMIERTIWPDGS